MSFATPWFLAGTALAAVVGLLLVIGGLGAARAVARFGDPERIAALTTSDPSKRRAWKGVLLVLATALAFVAAARPQYGKGTRLVPATNVDVVVVLDYSKSMYARDVEPSRIFRAKVEVARLIKELEGARFAAVAFAGEPMGFPLTADGSAIAQFLRQIDPNDMPVGGTAIGRALELARDLLRRDPKSADHKRIILLVTDGEDLEGSPVAVAQSIGAEGTTVHVVQIGGRTPEPLPEISEDGRIVGWRTDRQGKPLTTQLSAEGEQQLGAIAQATQGGKIIRAEKGSTGIDAIAADLRKQMSSELAERVETVYADVYFYPLGLAILLLIAEVFLTDAPRRRFEARRPPRGPKKDPLGRAKGPLLATFALACLGGGVFSATAGCSGWDPTSPFERNSPEVDRAIEELDAGQLESAEQALESYLGTGECSDAGIGLPDSVRQKPNGSFDLGLTLFHLAERFGHRFGDEELADGGPDEERLAELRGVEIECALTLVKAIGADPSVPADLRARARYIAGNLEFLRRKYEDAVKYYDQALAIIPGLHEEAGGDGIGRDAAWNRAIAQRRIQDQKDAGEDAPPDAPPDAEDASDGNDGDDAGEDAGEDGGQDGGDDGGQDGGGEDGGGDAGQEPDAGQQEPQPAREQPQDARQDERMLDQLEEAPTYQEEEAKNRAGTRRGRGMEDK